MATIDTFTAGIDTISAFIAEVQDTQAGDTSYYLRILYVQQRGIIDAANRMALTANVFVQQAQLDTASYFVRGAELLMERYRAA